MNEKLDTIMNVKRIEQIVAFFFGIVVALLTIMGMQSLYSDTVIRPPKGEIQWKSTGTGGTYTSTILADNCAREYPTTYRQKRNFSSSIRVSDKNNQDVGLDVYSLLTRLSHGAVIESSSGGFIESSVEMQVPPEEYIEYTIIWKEKVQGGILRYRGKEIRVERLIDITTDFTSHKKTCP